MKPFFTSHALRRLRDIVEEQLADLGFGHRSLLVARRFRIVYRVGDDILYVTDFSDVRQDPSAMRG